MEILQIINKKRLKKELTKQEIEFFVNEYTNNNIPDYQTSALLMAICLNGMNEQESIHLTDAMIKTGKIIKYDNIKLPLVDKHSTGGVGDTTTIALIPILACAGLASVKMSGAGLGFTGGTADKIRVFDNIEINFSENKAVSQLNKCGAIFCTQSNELAKADKKLYNLRDITGTIESIPLIASSIMSKKIACGNDTILLDVKVGNGAFMKNIKDAIELSKLMVKIGKSYNKNIGALITDMNQPLGNGIGCVLEIKDAIEVLQNKPSDLATLVKELAIKIMVLSKKYTNKEAFLKCEEIVSSGQALKKLQEIIENQNGNFINALNKISNLKPSLTIYAEEDGFIANYNTEGLGELVCNMGGGRKTLESEIDLNCGIYIHKRIGQKISKGEPLFDIYNGKLMELQDIKQQLKNLINISTKKVKRPKLIYNFIN